ncbi:uncharacterized protein BDZ99DRAFT_502637 [Mytilinidion resinicola]|uniref:Uncharacterized protein n=1 Tax=Mytilinidion resinicola TaxID=574789 RepID=A0A6A6Y7I6_9PEZI|nr:uncharacterized protein BDZ99DRAFT_502637 [Mytilinidion resinicola]KAF2804493.1 hypothetical protein BDZ99DRAFT_502637 [Mytilinidion resinicola]
MSSTGGPESELHDARRRELIQALDDALSTNMIRPTAWACLWLSDIQKLEDLLAQAQRSSIMIGAFLEAIETTTKIVPTWCQRKGAPTAASTPQDPSIPRSEPARDQASLS